MTMGDFQMQTARRLIALADEDGHEHDLSERDLLDYMGVMGVQFCEGAEASEEWARDAAERARRDG